MEEIPKDDLRLIPRVESLVLKREAGATENEDSFSLHYVHKVSLNTCILRHIVTNKKESASWKDIFTVKIPDLDVALPEKDAAALRFDKIEGKWSTAYYKANVYKYVPHSQNTFGSEEHRLKCTFVYLTDYAEALKAGRGLSEITFRYGYNIVNQVRLGTLPDIPTLVTLHAAEPYATVSVQLYKEQKDRKLAARAEAMDSTDGTIQAGETGQNGSVGVDNMGIFNDIGVDGKRIPGRQAHAQAMVQPLLEQEASLLHKPATIDKMGQSTMNLSNKIRVMMNATASQVTSQIPTVHDKGETMTIDGSTTSTTDTTITSQVSAIPTSIDNDTLLALSEVPTVPNAKIITGTNTTGGHQAVMQSVDRFQKRSLAYLCFEDNFGETSSIQELFGYGGLPNIPPFKSISRNNNAAPVQFLHSYIPLPTLDSLQKASNCARNRAEILSNLPRRHVQWNHVSYVQPYNELILYKENFVPKPLPPSASNGLWGHPTKDTTTLKQSQAGDISTVLSTQLVPQKRKAEDQITTASGLAIPAGKRIILKEQGVIIAPFSLPL